MFTLRAVLVLCLLCASLAAQQATVSVDASHVENHVSPRMYASFVEMMNEDVKWGLTAEMIHDRSFEEPVEYLGLPVGWSQEPDVRNDNGGAINFVTTTDEAYPKSNQATGKPEHSLRVTVGARDEADNRRGFSQGRLSIRSGVTYKGYFWAQVPEKSGYKGAITAALEEDNTDGPTYASATIEGVHGGWHKYEFHLTPKTTDRFAKLSLLFHGAGTLYIDEVSLEPADAHDEVRSDVEEMIRDLHPSFLRWPGGNVAQDYHWQWGVGPRDQRPIWTNIAWSNAPEPGDLGTDEYLSFCNRLHIEPSITVNVNGGGATPAEAAAWVEYVNGPATSKYGAMRAANGHPAPYNVKQWELGNEIFGAWVRGHVAAPEYARAAVVYAKAMLAVDPSLQLIAVGEGEMPDEDAWNSAVLEVAGPYIRYLAVHDYNASPQNASAANPRAQMFARAAGFEKNYLHIGDLIAQKAPGRDIRLIVNEWNLFYGAQVIQSMEGAVYAARVMNGFERDGNVVDSNAISDLVNGWDGGIIQSSRDRVYGTAQYYAVKMYGDHLGTDRLSTKTTSPELAPGVQSLDAVATRSEDGKRMFVKMSNARQEPLPVSVAISAFDHKRGATIEILSSGEPFRNTFTVPNAVYPKASKIECEATCKFTLGPDSVAVLTLDQR